MTHPVYTEFPIIYEDDHLVLINKPSGVLSHPNPLNEKKKLEGQSGRAAFLGHYDFVQRTFETPKGVIWLLHRLDQEASGILLAAKSATVATKLRLVFEKHSLQKIYRVLVGGGRVSPPQGKWHDHIGVRRHNKMRRASVQVDQAANAILGYNVEHYFEASRMTLLAVKLVTGKLHQIRIQCASHGHPVAGDKLYGDFKWNRSLQKLMGLKRLFLHASSLAFEHPVTGAPLKIEAPLTPELESVITKLHNFIPYTTEPKNTLRRKWTPPQTKKPSRKKRPIRRSRKARKRH